jgi:hypothetical protein
MPTKADRQIRFAYPASLSARFAYFLSLCMPC